MPVIQIQRPDFREGQYLTAQDLREAQEYQRQENQRHRLASHTWGIAAGLELEEVPQVGADPAVAVFIKPGYAVDGFGRPLVVLAPYKIPESLFAHLAKPGEPVGGRWIPVWLQYREEKTDSPRPGYSGCEGHAQAGRVTESFRVVVGDFAALSQQRSPVAIAGSMVEAGDPVHGFPDGSVPYQALPDSGDPARWLIRLGSVRWLAPSGVTPGHFVKSEKPEELAQVREGRPHIGIVAGSLLAPAGRLRIRDRRNPKPPSPETDELLGVEGSLRVDGRSHFRDLLITDDFVNIDSQNRNAGSLAPGPALTFGLLSFEGIASQRQGSGNVNGLDFYTANKPRMRISNAGDVSISGNLHVLGTFANPSDRRLKTNIIPLEQVLAKVRQLQGTSYEWNESYAALGHARSGRQIGLLAEEVESVFPELTTRWGEQGYLGLDYARLTTVLLEAVKELAAQNEALEQRIEALEPPDHTPPPEPSPSAPVCNELMPPSGPEPRRSVHGSPAPRSSRRPAQP